MLRWKTSCLIAALSLTPSIVLSDAITYGTRQVNVTAAGALQVDGSLVTQPVSCVSGCSGSGSVGTSTITYAGVAQPVNVQNFPGSQAVTGTFWQNTQPVSVATMPSTPVTGTFWQQTQPISGSVSVSNLPALQSVYVTNPTTTSITGTVPVSGTFFQATQPVSIASMPSTPVTGTFWQATQPVSGTFWQSVQPVSQSGSWTPSCSISGSSNTVQVSGTVPVSGTFWQATQPISGSVSISGTPNVNSTSVNVTTVSVTGTPTVNINGTVPVSGTFFQATQPVSGTVTANVTPPGLTKATQGSTGFSTQDLKDAGRTYVVLVATGVAGVTTEALFTFAQNKQGVKTDGVTSYTITNGKTLRIQGLYCASRDGATSISWTRAVLRHNTGGATTATSPMIAATEAGGSGALAGSTGNSALPFPDGVEIFGNGTQSIAVSHLDSATTNVVTCSLTAYEY